MNFFYNIILNFILIIFPFFIYLLVKLYFPKQEKTTFIICSFMSLIIFIVYGKHLFIESSIILFIPLIFNYICNNKKTSFIISICLIAIYYYLFNISIYLLILEYFLYYFIYIFYSKKDNFIRTYINKFIIVKSYFLSFYIFQKYLENNINLNIVYISISIIIAYIISYLFYYILDNFISLDEYKTLKRKYSGQENLKNYLCAITHELKNSLSISKGYLDIMKNKNKEEYIKIIRKEVNRSINMIQDGLNISKDKFNFEIIDINLLLEDVSNTLELLFKKKNIKYRVSYIDDDIYILGDYEKLKQVLLNIIKNSVESKEKDLKIDMSIYLSKDNICISIEDNGIGIENITNIGSNYTSKINGSGLGTIFSKNIIEKHRGKIIYESEKDIGTTVDILLPIFK